MKKSPKITPPNFNSAEFIARPVLIFMGKYYSDLWHTARFLGGYDAARLVDRCVELLERERGLAHRAQNILEQIASLLALEHDGDPDRPLMGFFVAIDPGDPIVKDIHDLRDRLLAALSEAEERRIWTETRSKFHRAA